MLVITGPGRSGTSALSGFLFKLGFITGDYPYNDRIRGGHEDMQVVDINNRIFRGEAWSAEEIKSVDKRVIKDPRFFIPVVLDAWLENRDDLSFLVSFRDLGCVNQAYEKHLQYFSTHQKVDELPDMNKRSAHFFINVFGQGIPTEVLTFPDYLDKFDKVVDSIERLSDLQIPREEGKRIWDRWMDNKKVHFRR